MINDDMDARPGATLDMRTACEHAGTIAKIETSMPNLPGRAANLGPKTLIQAEGQGRVTELTIDDNKADVRVVKDGLTGATGVTVVGDTALPLVERAKAVVVPYRGP
jgi:hypothetical protein